VQGLRGVQAGLTEHVERVSSGVHKLGLGLKMFADATEGGMAPGELLLIVARSGVGKTYLGLQSVFSNPHLPALFFSLEMPWPQLCIRLVTMASGPPTWTEKALIEKGEMPQRFQDVVEQFPLFMCDDRSGIGMKDMVASVEAAQGQLGEVPAIIVIDYLELVRAAAIDQGGLVNKVAQNAKELAKHFNTRVVLLHQANRAEGGSGSKPLSTSAARFGGDMAADYMLTAWRPGLEAGVQYANPDEVYLALPKNRHGIPVLHGIRHRMVDGRIYEWNDTPFAPSKSIFDDEDDPYREVMR